MNTRDNWLTTATIHDIKRLAFWGLVFPGGVVPIKSILTQKVNVPGHRNSDAYMLDLDALTDDQLWGVCHVISSLFNYPIEEVRAEIGLGVPILAEGTSVSTRDQGLAMSLMLDDGAKDFWDRGEELIHEEEWEDD